MLRKYGRQRTDSTHVLGAVERLTRLEMVWETLRTIIAALERQVSTWYTQVIPAAFAETYGKRRSEWKVSAEETAKELQQAGRDGFWLLAQLDQGYPSGPNLAQSHARHIELRGPVSSDTNKKSAGYQQTDFDVDMRQHRAVCPHGKVVEHQSLSRTVGGETG